MSFYDVQVFPMSNRQRYEARILEAQMSIRASLMRIHEARMKIREALIQDARMKLQDLALRSDEERVKSAGEIADMWRPYKGVMEILDHHIGQKEIKEIIFTLCKYQKPCPSWYPCPPWCACGGFNNPERYTYEETRGAEDAELVLLRQNHRRGSAGVGSSRSAAGAELGRLQTDHRRGSGGAGSSPFAEEAEQFY